MLIINNSYLDIKQYKAILKLLILLNPISYGRVSEAQWVKIKVDGTVPELNNKSIDI